MFNDTKMTQQKVKEMTVEIIDANRGGTLKKIKFLKFSKFLKFDSEKKYSKFFQNPVILI